MSADDTRRLMVVMSAGGMTAPTNSVAPTITPANLYDTDPPAGLELGTWTGAPTFTYQWQRRNAGVWTDIAGATTATLALAALTDVEIRCAVTGTNPAGSLTATTAGKTVISGA